MVWILSIIVVAIVLYRMERPQYADERRSFLRTKTLPRYVVICSRCVLVVASLSCLWLVTYYAFGRPSLSLGHVSYPTRSVMFVVDTSSSMASAVADATKLSVVQQSLTEAVQRRDAEGYHDSVGIMAFSRAARVVQPFSCNRELFSKNMQSMVPMSTERTNGSAIGYAIYKTSVLFSACREWSNTPYGQMLILVTDGIEDPHPNDRASIRWISTMQALQQAKRYHVCVYYVHIGQSTRTRLERDMLVEAIESTGGAYWEASSPQDISSLLDTMLRMKPEQQEVWQSRDGGRVFIVMLLISVLAQLWLNWYVRSGRC